MQITEQAHADLAAAIRRAMLNPNVRPGEQDEYLAHNEHLGATLDGEAIDEIGPVGSLTATITDLYVQGDLTAQIPPEELGVTADEQSTYNQRGSLDVNELAILCQVAAAYGLQLDIVFSRVPA